MTLLHWCTVRASYWRVARPRLSCAGFLRVLQRVRAIIFPPPKRMLHIQELALKMDADSAATSSLLSFWGCQACSCWRGEDKTGAGTAGQPAAALLWRRPILVAGAIGGTCCDTDPGPVNRVPRSNTIGIIREWSSDWTNQHFFLKSPKYAASLFLLLSQCTLAHLFQSFFLPPETFFFCVCVFGFRWHFHSVTLKRVSSVV